LRRPEQTAVFIIRAWRDEGQEDVGLRARITETLDVTEPGSLETSAATDAKEILVRLHAWLEDVSAGP
jgi:hypothetical protein